jgi:hypothetical protein
VREAKALVLHMPHTLSALARGDVGEWTAALAVAETACLTAENRRRVDAELSDRLPTLGPARVGAEAWAAVCRLDPAAAVKRYARAVTERRVSLRPAPEAMTYLTALLPVRDGVACHAALARAVADAAASGDPRTRGQVMTDCLVERVTGQPAQYAPRTSAASGPPSSGAAVLPQALITEPGSSDDASPDGSAGEPVQTVEIHLVMTDRALLASDDEPALVTGSGIRASNPAGNLVPAVVARDLVRDADRAWVRRLFADPESGQLVGMESSRRVFDGHLRRMLLLRDRVCRTPWCEAPIRHGDHVVAHADGGPTSLDNGQGLCERCNQTKNLPGWTAQTTGTTRAGRDPGGGHVVRTTTPTGHSYDSTAPPLLGGASRAAAVATARRTVKPSAARRSVPVS